MTSTSYTLKLIRPARSQGGDLYHTSLDDDSVWKIYVPQTISRDGDNPRKQLEIVINHI